MAWGYHLSIDGYDCDLAQIKSRENVERFSETLVRRIDMTPHGGPLVINFGTGPAEGFTLVQLIETSNICAHFANGSRALYLDVFSCKKFDQKVVEDTVKEFFGAQKIKKRFLERT